MDEERKFNLSVDIKEKKKSGTVLMTEGSIWKKLLIFSVPLILGNLLQQLYSTVDSIIVGNCVGKEALAAVGSTGSIVSLLIAFSQGASVGAGVIISQYMGAKRKDDVKSGTYGNGNRSYNRPCADGHGCIYEQTVPRLDADAG